MATYTPESFQQHLSEKLRSLKIAEEIVYPVATATMDKMRQRLFQTGTQGDGSKTGNYSTEPIYASKSQFKNTGGFSPTGKKGTQKTTVSYKTKSGKVRTKKVAIKSDHTERKTMYLPGGYKEFRHVQGMETGFVNLQYSGDLFTDFTKLTTVFLRQVVIRRELQEQESLARGLRGVKRIFVTTTGGFLHEHSCARTDDLEIVDLLTGLFTEALRFQAQ